VTFHLVCHDCPELEELHEDGAEAHEEALEHVDEHPDHKASFAQVDGSNADRLMTDGGQPSDDELTEETPCDIISVTTPAYAHGRIQTEFFYGEVDQETDTLFSVEVHQDGPNIALSAGTSSLEEEKDLHTYHALSPGKARRIGNALLEAADQAAKQNQPTEQPDSTQEDDESASFLRRLMD